MGTTRSWPGLDRRYLGSAASLSPTVFACEVLVFQYYPYAITLHYTRHCYIVLLLLIVVISIGHLNTLLILL